MQQISNRKKPIKISSIILFAFLILLVIVYITPLLWIVSVSLKSKQEVFKSPFSLPESIQLVNYTKAWTIGRLGKSTLNSLIVCSITLLSSMLLGSMAAFAIARMKWKFADSSLTYFLLGMMIPVHCILIPLFSTFSKLGLNNSLTGLVLPYASFSLPMTIFIMVGFFRSMPKELLESACIDGSSIYGCFFRIALPLAKTGLFVTGLMTFVNNWNELLMAMVFISNPESKTLPVALTYFVGPHSTNYVQMFAAIVIAITPTVIVYSIFSNQIVEGLTTGAVKG